MFLQVPLYHMIGRPAALQIYMVVCSMNMVCTVTIMKLQSDSWWFLACKKCHKTSYPARNEFVCSDPNCPCVVAGPRYKICLIGNDNTGEAQFVFFASVAEQIIGKTVDVVQHVSERRQGAMPAEIAALVSQKLTLNFSVTEKSLEFEELAFQVNRIDVIHSKENKFQFQALASGSKQRNSIIISPRQTQDANQGSQVQYCTSEVPSETGNTSEGSNILSKTIDNEHGPEKKSTPPSDIITTPTSNNKQIVAPGALDDSAKKDHCEKS